MSSACCDADVNLAIEEVDAEMRTFALTFAMMGFGAGTLLLCTVAALSPDVEPVRVQLVSVFGFFLLAFGSLWTGIALEKFLQNQEAKNE